MQDPDTARLRRQITKASWNTVRTRSCRAAVSGYESPHSQSFVKMVKTGMRHETGSPNTWPFVDSSLVNRVAASESMVPRARGSTGDDNGRHRPAASLRDWKTHARDMKQTMIEAEKYYFPIEIRGVCIDNI